MKIPDSADSFLVIDRRHQLVELDDGLCNGQLLHDSRTRFETRLFPVPSSASFLPILRFYQYRSNDTGVVIGLPYLYTPSTALKGRHWYSEYESVLDVLALISSRSKTLSTTLQNCIVL